MCTENRDRRSARGALVPAQKRRLARCSEAPRYGITGSLVLAESGRVWWGAPTVPKPAATTGMRFAPAPCGQLLVSCSFSAACADAPSMAWISGAWQSATRRDQLDPLSASSKLHRLLHPPSGRPHPHRHRQRRPGHHRPASAPSYARPPPSLDLFALSLVVVDVEPCDWTTPTDLPVHAPCPQAACANEPQPADVPYRLEHEAFIVIP